MTLFYYLQHVWKVSGEIIARTVVVKGVSLALALQLMEHVPVKQDTMALIVIVSIYVTIKTSHDRNYKCLCFPKYRPWAEPQNCAKVLQCKG